MSEYLAEIDAFDPQGWNLYSSSTSVAPVVNSSKSAQTADGFIISGIAANTGVIRLANLLPSNGTFTVSFDAQTDSSAANTFALDFCDSPLVGFSLTTSFQHFSFTFTISNWTLAVYNFIDINGLGAQNHIFTNFIVEYGSIETVWSTQMLGRNLLPNSMRMEHSTAYGFAGTSTPIPLKKGKTYTFTANGRSTALANSQGHWLEPIIYDGSWLVLNNAIVINELVDTTKSITFIAPSDVIVIVSSYLFPAGGTRTGEVFLNWYKLEEGATSTAWSPAPEDNINKGFTRKLCFSASGCIAVGRYYEPRLLNPGSLKMMMFSDGTTMGASTLGYGELSLVNTDGGLDYLLDAGISGRSAVIKELIAGAAVLLMSCSSEQVTLDSSTVNIRIKDPQQAFTVPVQPNKYAGNNALPDGVEGVADIAGKPKPILLGEVSNATPICVNTSRLIYQLRDGALFSIPNVYDSGVSLTAGSPYTSFADMQANPPNAGEYRAYLAGGMFRLGSSPFGAVTADGIQGATAADRTAAKVALAILSKASFTSYDSASFAALDTLNNSVIGIYITDETTVAVALDEVVNSIGAYYGFDAANTLHVGRLDAPVAAPIVTLTDSEIRSIDRLATQDEGRGVPTWKTTINYDKNYTVQGASNLAGGVFANPAWNTASLLAKRSWSGMCYGNGTFVMMDSANATTVCITSTDGYNWVERTVPTTGYGGYTDVAYGNGVFVAVGSDGKALTSTNGISWTQRTIFAGSNFSPIRLVFGNGVFVAVGIWSSTQQNIAVSTNGITWVDKTFTADLISSLAFGNGRFVAIGGQPGISNSVLTSPDGYTWSTVVTTGEGGNNWSDITYGNGIFVAVEGSSAASSRSRTSTDGVTWTMTQMPTSDYWCGISYGNGVFVAIENRRGMSVVSTDGVTWQPVNMPSTYFWYRLFFGKGLFITPAPTVSIAAVYKITSGQLLRAYASKQYRTVLALDPAIKTTYLNASEITINTLVKSPAAAQAEATRQLNLRKVRRDYISIKVKRNALAIIPNLGDVVSIQYPRYGYDAGKKFVVIGFTMLLDSNDIIIQLWG
jgi:hypothetical protein